MKFKVPKPIIIFLITCLVHVLKAQDSHITKGIIEQEHQTDWCPSGEIHKKAIANDPNYRLEQEKFEKTYQRSIINSTNNPYSLRTSAVSTIPVVVHVFHSGQAIGTQENPSDDMLKLWIQKTTERFRHTSGATFANNPFSGVDCEIDLCLSRRDPSGNPSSGIKRYNIPSIAVMPSGFNTTQFNPYMWDKTKYCNLIIVTSSPPDYSFVGVAADNITIYVSTGMGSPTNPNSGLAAHELGHYLGLAHNFEGGCVNNKCLTDGDGICDTPPKATSGYSSPTTCAAPSNSCDTDDDDLSTNNPFRPIANGGLGDRLDGLENYMDYTASCWAAFTQGQKARMQTNLTFRTALTGNAAACNIIPNACSIPVDLTSTVSNSNAQLFWGENANATSWEIKYGASGFNPASAGTSITVTAKPYLLPNLTANSTYDWYVRAICPSQPSGYSAFSAVNRFTTPSTFVYCTVTYTQPCLIQSHPTGNIPTTIANFSLKKTSDNSTVINNINNGCLGSISDHTAIVGNVTAGTTYSFTVTYGLNSINYCYFAYTALWVDYNNDKDFDDANENIYLSPTFGGCDFTGNFTIPANTPNGAKRLRVRRSNSAIQASGYCASSYSGETEDYTLNVTGGTVLPLTLLSFSANVQVDKTIAIDWRTSDEKNIAYFDIERSFDGKYFEKIGQIKAMSNTSTPQNYHFIDNPQQQNVVYYRLKMIDSDHSFNYSPIQSVKLTSKNTIAVYPNPVSKDKGLTFEATVKEEFDLKIMDLQGRVIVQTRFSQQTTLYLNDAAQGLYIYELTSKNLTQFGKILLE